MKIIVDTNIFFSFLPITNGNIGNVFFENKFKFYSWEFLKVEIKKHWVKLFFLSKLNENDLEISYNLLLSKIIFVTKELIPRDVYVEAKNLVKDINLDDTEFIANAIFWDGYLWNKDKVLYAGLKNKGFKKVLNTNDVMNFEK